MTQITDSTIWCPSDLRLLRKYSSTRKYQQHSINIIDMHSREAVLQIVTIGASHTTSRHETKQIVKNAIFHHHAASDISHRMHRGIRATLLGKPRDTFVIAWNTNYHVIASTMHHARYRSDVSNCWWQMSRWCMHLDYENTLLSTHFLHPEIVIQQFLWEEATKQPLTWSSLDLCFSRRPFFSSLTISYWGSEWGCWT